MRFLRLIPLLFLLVSCGTAPPLVSFFISDGVIQHFLSPTVWKAKGSKAKLDVTFRTGEDTPAIVNISFYGNKTTPRNVSSVSLRGMETECPLEFSFIIFAAPDKNELRVSFFADKDELVELLKAEPITLAAQVDGIEYVHTPKKNFYKLKDKFLIAISVH